MMFQYAVVNYTNDNYDDNEIDIIHVTDNFDYANKLAFNCAKKELPPNSIYEYKYKIIKNYRECERTSVYMLKSIVDYRICQLNFDNDCEEYEKYDINNVLNIIWAVVKFNNDVENVEEIDEDLIYKD